MKLFAFYRHPFTNDFSLVSRREAAHLIGQWRRNGFRAKRLVCGERRAYSFQGEHGETAAVVLKETELVSG
jgi:hypothetical protein